MREELLILGSADTTTTPFYLFHGLNFGFTNTFYYDTRYKEAITVWVTIFSFNDSFIHSLTLLLFTYYLLCAKHCVRHIYLSKYQYK